MSSTPPPNDEHYDPEYAAGTPLEAAVTALAERLGRPAYTMPELTMGEICQLAVESYGDDLPEFWRIWIDWNRNDPPQPMGDL